MNIDVLVWRAEEIDGHGDLVTPAALQDMAAGLPGTAILFNYDIRNMIGRVVQAWVRGKELHATIQIGDPGIADSIMNGRAAVRPGFEILRAHDDNGRATKIIDSIGEVSVSVTTTPMRLPGEQE